MNRDPLAIRRSDNPKDTDVLIAKRKAAGSEDLSHADLCARIDRNILGKVMVRDLEFTAVVHWDQSPQQACEELTNRLRTGAL